MSKWTKKTNFDKNLEQLRLPLRKNYKRIPKDWLKLEIQRQKSCRNELTDFSIFGSAISEDSMTEEQFIKEYEEAQKLSDFFFVDNEVSDFDNSEGSENENSTNKLAQEDKEITKKGEKEDNLLSKKENSTVSTL